MSVIRIALICLLGASCFGAPNIVFFMIDDFGLESMYDNGTGSDTNYVPNAELMADDGMKFENMNSEVSCYPSRAVLMTGRATYRSGITTYIPTNEVTFAKRLQDVGYNTAMVGKWQLYNTNDGANDGFADIEEYLEFHGFDYTASTAQILADGGLYSNWADPADYSEYIQLTNAINFLETATEPFLLYYCPNNPHSPAHVPIGYGTTAQDTGSEYYGFKGQTGYADYCFSNVLATLDAEGFADNTVVFFCGDNGNAVPVTISYQGTDLTGGKGAYDEKSFRVPFLMKYPGNIATGSVYSAISCFADVPVTICDLAGTTMPTDRLIDGKSFKLQLLGSQTPHRTSMQSAYETDTGYSGCKTTDFKLVVSNGVESLFDVSNWPYGDTAAYSWKALESVTKVRLSGEYSNFTNKAYGDTVWGGHSNEVWMAQ